MTQNRDAPAFQEYAAAMLARLPFRKMTLQDRGLLFTMRLECWVNVRLPAEHGELAKVLGVPVSEIASSLAAVTPFFEALEEFIICPELENYRAYLAERRSKQSQGGKAGSAITNKKRSRIINAEDAVISSISTGTSRLPHRTTRDSLDQTRAKQPSQNQSSGAVVLDDQFVDEYEAFEASEKCTADEYKASRS
ncbi:hypothetical protein GALL_451970 [mine drainage metagenome]|uniref:DUF1376 domain-containing protein n=1 Tax=mine drainage metagenome TaxID=410659 RepID=A0A1J5PNL5_9ZZZZ